MMNATVGKPLNPRLSALLWGLLGVFLVGYGLVAFNAGTKIAPVLSTSANADETVGYIMAQADQGVPMANTPEAEVLPFWINLIARLESSEYVHGSDSIMQTEQHFYAMGETKRTVLSTHMMLGLVIMTTGFFQFWPAFRRKYRKTHRVLGVTYIAAAVVSMSMSGYYLLNNPVANTYSEFVFYVGLWYLLVLSLVSISIAGFAIFKRNIPVHLGWQALAFGCFLSAPIQRALWVGLAPASDGATFNEVNMLVNVCLFAFCWLAAYLLFYVNRNSSPYSGAQTEAVAMHPMLRRAVGGVLFGLWVIAVLFFLVAPGLGGSEFIQQVVPASAVQWHDGIMGSALVWVLVAAMTVLLVSGARLLLASSGSKELSTGTVNLLLVSAVAVAALYLTWGSQLGWSSHEHSVAGVMYGVTGLMMLCFLALVVHGLRSGQVEKTREWLWFLVLLAATPAMMYLMLFLLAATDFVPERYVAMGHGYQIAAALAAATPIMVGHLIAVHSRFTKQYAVN